ncbi:helix-turn-helix domain-containing protein [Phaeobacter sp. B1627]|uniref:helix-turn-helix domain-containing protein n=1 Tax=Phaeobacter sp. B1627 TaxID=2583809 RepID=UPI00159EC8E6|nr:helix-turn-helix domain-containing protein [Phaeobacter sp. B1627]
MLDGMMPEEVKVWGGTVPVSPSGRRMWPEALRAKVVNKVLSGARIRETAEAIGADKSLVALWVRKAEADNANPAFVEVTAPSVPPPAAAPHGNSPSVNSSGFCRISIGEAVIEIPPGYPVDHLAEVFRAVGAAQ